MVLAFMFGFVFHPNVFAWYGERIKGFLSDVYAIVSAPFIDKHCLSPLNCRGVFIKETKSND
jgi:hypothetical protein